MLSIIIPVYNEAEVVESNLRQIQQRIGKPDLISDILVIDGGSTDQTFEKAKSIEGIKVYTSEKGRARQMNFGARKARGTILYFLHIDSLPPPNFEQMIVDSVEKGHLAGCFRMSFRSEHPWLRLISWMTKFKARSCRGGDQSLFVATSLFKKVGGYNENFKIYEDHEILKPLYQQTDFDVIQEKITTSARRFKTKGVLTLQLLFWMVYFKKWMGASPENLYRFYEKHINN